MSKNNHSSFFVIKVMKKRITSIVLAISHPKLFANKNQGEWKLYSWLNVPAHAVNARVDPLPLSVTQRPVWTWVTVQPSAMSPLTPQEKHLMRKFWVLECKPISLNWIHGGKKKRVTYFPVNFIGWKLRSPFAKPCIWSAWAVSAVNLFLKRVEI